MHEKKLSNSIVRVIIIYILVTMFLYFFGPLRYNYQNNVRMIFFIANYIFVFILGINIAVRYIKIRPRTFKKLKGINLERTLFIFGTLTYLVIGLFQFYNNVGTLNFNIVLNMLLNSFGNAGELYQLTLEESMTQTGSWLTRFESISSPLTFAVIPLGILNYKKIKSIPLYLLWYFSIFVQFTVNALSGTTLGLFKIIFPIVGSLIIVSQRRKSIKKGKKSFLPRFVGFVFIAVILLGFLNNVTSRISNLSSFYGNVFVDRTNFMLRILPPAMQQGFVLLVSYLSQGYYGFSLTFNYNWTPTFPFGHSTFLMNYSDLVGLNPEKIFERTYIAKMNTVWSSRTNWHTSFTWFANDLSHLGVLLVMFLLGILLGISIKGSLNEKMLPSLIFILMLIFIIFIPMNNLVFSNPLFLIPFYTYLILLLINYRFSIIVRK